MYVPCQCLSVIRTASQTRREPVKQVVKLEVTTAVVVVTLVVSSELLIEGERCCCRSELVTHTQVRPGINCLRYID